jgi:SAM-dependent methyltransferase
MLQTLPALDPLPDNIEDEIQRLLQSPDDPALEAWLVELIRQSGHMSTSDDLQWRLLCLVWLAIEFDVDKAWPYLMWLNMKEPTISSHLSQLLIEAVDNFNAHLQMADWLANLKDARLVTFFKDFQVVPAQRKMQPLLSSLFAYPDHPKVGTWLATFCEGTRYNDRAYMRPWRLLTAAWYAAGFDTEQGLTYLRELLNGSETISALDNKQLMDAATETNGLAVMIQMIADCPSPAVKTILKDFGHPDLATLAETALQRSPAYNHLAEATKHVEADVEIFHWICNYLAQAGYSPKNTAILELGCGPLASQTVLFASTGYKTLGVDLEIPPGYLPLPGVKQWFRRNQHHKAWQQATSAYYQALAQQAGLKPQWGKVKIRLADLTRLDLADSSYEVVICANYLQHAPNVEGLLAEAARVLKPGGLFVAAIRPYAAFNGAFPAKPKNAWGHLTQPISGPAERSLSFNKWRETQYQQALEKYFTIEQWLAESEPGAQAQLTPEVRSQLASYSEAELTRKQIIVAAKK